MTIAQKHYIKYWNFGKFRKPLVELKPGLVLRGSSNGQRRYNGKILAHELPIDNLKTDRSFSSQFYYLDPNKIISSAPESISFLK